MTAVRVTPEAEPDSARGPRSLGTLAALVTMGGLLLAMLVGLGLWQLQRLAWKEDLLARLAQQQQAAPRTAPGPAEWPALAPAASEYRRVTVRGQFKHDQETLVRASTELGTGYWVMTPLRAEGGFWLLVNRGFVPVEQKARAARAGAEPDSPQTVTGLMRQSEPGGSLLQANDPAAGRWYSRDVAAIARARSAVGGTPIAPVAPYFIDLIADPSAPGAWPRAGLTVLNFSNNHLQYALTWFALAAMLAWAIGHVLQHERRLRQTLGDAPRVQPRDP